ncbi:methylmalonyl-CoA mutase subunit beta [Flavobacterium pallidum]|uniref:Methylmalonyl-CoA mutase n=1 Tax=Flavobacterium pallidum TaxID=2172098 RepID=A0A2S1SHP2_9FLAO|nr:methylmalonyl-CoA mutase subunit beta [Flavobacterium pallidum]AWI25862.1 methylmalonyl-CoA mutase [Flavobacterium pallidum]
MTKPKLFNTFGPVSSKQWKQQIQFELRGADYNETLVWESPEGIKVKPFYHIDEGTAILQPKSAEGFSICEDIFVFELQKSIARALDCLSRGAESLRFHIPSADTEIEKLLSALPLETTPVYLSLSFISDVFIEKVAAFAKDKKAQIYCLIDPVGHLAKEGNWIDTPGKDNFKAIAALPDHDHMSIISIDAGLYQNAGANIVQQLAYSLSHANEYFNHIPDISKPPVFQVSIGSNYFFEIAKLRALRILFDLVAKEYGIETGCHIIATPSKRNKTLYDYNVNMLRTTTECMAAIAGGADAISNMPYDALYHKGNEFGGRISRNQLLILKHESYFDKVENPADGSYYIESLTQQLAEKALTLFKEIEAAGGFLKQLSDGTINKKINESAAREQELFDSGKEVLLGTNKYPNKNDRMKQELELFPFVKIKPRKTLLTPIIEKRLAEKIEQERLDTETENS